MPQWSEINRKKWEKFSEEEIKQMDEEYILNKIYSFNK